MTGQMPGDPGQPPEKKGMSNGAIVAIAIVALVLLLFGVCLIVPRLAGSGA